MGDNMKIVSDQELKDIIHDVVKKDKEEVLRICSNYEEAANRPDEVTEEMLFNLLKMITEEESFDTTNTTFRDILSN